MKNTPTKDRVLVRLAAAPTDQKIDGIHIPQASVERPDEGVVVATGPTVTGLKLRDKVLLPKFGGVEVKLDKVNYRLMREDEVLMVLEREAEVAK